jgi:hypothetical protein
MLFESTTLLLRSVVNSLDSQGETAWEDHLEYGRQCLYELAQMSRSSSRAYKAGDPNPKFHAAVVPAFERAARTIPHVKLMNAALRKKDRLGALQNGRTAVAEMDGKVTSTPIAATPPASSSKPDAVAEVRQRTIQRRNSDTKNRKPKTKRKSSRVLTASHS